mgnify:CR=1 FL=1
MFTALITVIGVSAPGAVFCLVVLVVSHSSTIVYILYRLL